MESIAEPARFKAFARRLNFLTIRDKMAAAAIRSRYGPNLPERELRLRLASLRLDRDTMIRIFGWDPEAEGY